MKKYFKKSLMFSLIILISLSFGACEKEEKQALKEPVFYIAKSKDGESIRYEEGEYIDYELNENKIGIVGAFDIEEGVFSYLVNGKHYLAKLSGDQLNDEYYGLESKFKVKDERVFVEPESFLPIFGFVIEKETLTEDKENSGKEKDEDRLEEGVEKKQDEESLDESVDSEGAKNETKKHKLLMAWDNYANNSKIQFADSLDIVIAKNMSLAGGNGDSNAVLSKKYIENAKNQGKTVWFMVTNAFNPDMTKEFLNSYLARKKYIDSIVNFAVVNDLDGVSLDFENMYLDDSDLYVQFVAELHRSLEKEGITLGVCVTVPGGSDMWSKVFDRERIADYSDYLMLMAYDQHWASSQVSGPVASKAWVKDNLVKLSQSIDKDKIILGVPFYTRVWYESYSNEVANKVTVHSKDFYMVGIRNILAKLKEGEYKRVWDQNASQYFFVYYAPELKETVKFWFDDADAVARKANLINEFDLPAAAFWALGFEDDVTWQKLKAVKEGKYQ